MPFLSKAVFEARLADMRRLMEAESLDGLALVADGEQRWADAARLLARAEAIRSDVGLQRSSGTAALITTARTHLARAVGDAELARLHEEAATLDLHALVGV